jgi:hypothetical protein
MPSVPCSLWQDSCSSALAVIAQMVRIQNSEQAKIFLSQGDLYAGEFRTFHPERGEIYDRNGHLLAGNRTVYEVGVSLRDMEDVDAMVYVLGTYLGHDLREVRDRLLNSPETWTYIVVKDYVDANTVAALQEVVKQLKDADDNRLDGLGSSRTSSAVIPKGPWPRTCSALSRAMDAATSASRRSTTTCWRATRSRSGCRAIPTRPSTSRGCPTAPRLS